MSHNSYIRQILAVPLSSSRGQIPDTSFSTNIEPPWILYILNISYILKYFIIISCKCESYYTWLNIVSVNLQQTLSVHFFPGRMTPEGFLSFSFLFFFFKYYLLFSHSVVSDSLWPHGLHHTRLSCPSLSPRVCSNSRPLTQWCHLTILFSVTPFSFSVFPNIKVFSKESVLCIR